MKVLESEEAILVSWSPESTTAFTIKYDPDFFDTMVNEIKAVYHSEPA